MKKIFRKIFAPVSRAADKATLFREQAIQKADDISKGEKIVAPHYPREEKLLKELAKDEKIKETINKKYDSVIENVAKITITSADPPEPSKTKRELPKRRWEYEHKNKEEYEYGFHEPPLHKIEKNRLMFREALEGAHGIGRRFKPQCR